jgi:hypothetical protein
MSNEMNVGPNGEYYFPQVVNVLRTFLRNGNAKAEHPLMTQRHPRFEEMREHWAFLIQSYTGGPGWLRENLFQYFKEGDEEFKDRLRRSFRQNLCREIIEIWTAAIFKEAITRESSAPQPVLEFWKKTDKEGRTIDEFMQEVSDLSKAVSPLYIVVDVPSRKAEHVGVTLSKAMEDEAGYSKPYAYTVLPTAVLDMSFDEDGRFNWIAIEETGRDDADPLFSSRAIIRRIRLWTKQEWILFEVQSNKTKNNDLVELARDTHGLGVVPVIQFSHKTGLDKYTGASLIEDIAYKDRAIANHESQLGTIVADQTFSQLFMPKNGNEGSYGRDMEGRVSKLIELGTKRVATFDGSGTHKPFFASPDASQAKFILDLIKQMRSEIYKQAILDSEGGEASQGGAKTATERAYNFKKLNGALAKNASGLQNVERQIVQLVCAWLKLPIDSDALKSLVKYADDFDVKAVSDDLNEAVLMQTITQFGPAFWSAYLERIVDKVLPDLANNERQAIIDEINQNAEFLHSISQSTQTVMLDGLQNPTPDPNADPDAQNEDSEDANPSPDKATE